MVFKLSFAASTQISQYDINAYFIDGAQCSVRNAQANPAVFTLLPDIGRLPVTLQTRAMVSLQTSKIVKRDLYHEIRLQFKSFAEKTGFVEINLLNMLHLRNGISQSLNFSIITDFFKKIICRLRSWRNKQAV